jgi:hypothetical protein
MRPASAASVPANRSRAPTADLPWMTLRAFARVRTRTELVTGWRSWTRTARGAVSLAKRLCRVYVTGAPYALVPPWSGSASPVLRSAYVACGREDDKPRERLALREPPHRGPP